MCDSEKFESPEIAEFYVKFRPSYGPEVFDTIVSFCKESPSAEFSLAVDVGCGSGQSTVPLAEHFRKVIGLDASEAQISKAPRDIPNLSFRVASGEDLSFLDSASIDLVTMAASLHWMDSRRVFPEVERVLKPGGSFVAYSSGKPDLVEPLAQEIYEKFFKDHMYKYISSHVKERYHSFTLPFASWRRNDSLKMERNWTVDELLGYMKSWATYHKFLEDNPKSTALSDLRERLLTVHRDGKGEDSDCRLLVRWSIFMLMGHKPQA